MLGRKGVSIGPLSTLLESERIPGMRVAADAAPRSESVGDDVASPDDPGEDPFMPSERSGLFDFSGLGPLDPAPASDTTGAPTNGSSNPLLAMLPLIRSSARVGTLMKRIRHYFALDRFDVDVVVCRRGDSNRRQLRNDVRLSRYALTE